MTKCVDCRRTLDPEDGIMSTASGRLTNRGQPRCSPCYHRACFPTAAPSSWIVDSLACAFTILTPAHRRRLNSYLKAGNKIMAGKHLFSRYWVYEGMARLEVIACGAVPKQRKVLRPEPTWVKLRLRLEHKTSTSAVEPALSYDVAMMDASQTYIKTALRRRPRKEPVSDDPLDSLC